VAANQSLISVPVDITDEDVLKRFLIRLVELVDLQLGLRGNNPAVKADDLTEVREAIDNLLVLLEERVETIEEIKAEFSSPFGVLTGLEDV